MKDITSQALWLQASISDLGGTLTFSLRPVALWLCPSVCSVKEKSRSLALLFNYGDMGGGGGSLNGGRKIGVRVCIFMYQKCK